MARILVVGTADTKGAELAFLADRIRLAGGAPVIVDLGTGEPSIRPDITAGDVARAGAAGTADAVKSGDRGRAVAAMTDAFAAWLPRQTDIGGVVGIGGGGGSAMVSAGLRALPFGVPKILVSTLASGDTAPYVGVSDIVMMPSITDLAGLNRISRTVLANAAQAITAMASRPALAQDADRPAIGLTMFGVTTPCVTRIARLLEADYDCLVFHATGTGGRSMEKLAGSGMLTGILDITTTEVCDLLYGGVLPAGPDRLDVVAQTRLPYVGSVGALDMINFWAPETVPQDRRERLLYRHNPNVTLMRTTADECRAIGRWIADKLNRCEGPVRFLIPEKGVSALDAEGAAFHDVQADAALFEAIEQTLVTTPTRQLQRLPLHINDPAFADAAVAAFRAIA